LTELNAAQWSAWAQDGTASTSDDPTRKTTGAASVKFVTDGGFDTYLRFPPAFAADWDLSARHEAEVQRLCRNPSPSTSSRVR